VAAGPAADAADPPVVRRDRRRTVLLANTAKTHAVSIYRNLDAGTRGQAVDRARKLGLLEG